MKMSNSVKAVPHSNNFMKKIPFSSLVFCLTVWPSWSFFSGIGTTPLGIILVPLTRQFVFLKKELLAMLFLVIALLLSVKNYSSLFELCKLMIGPLALIYFKNIDLHSEYFKKIALIVLGIYFFEGLLSLRYGFSGRSVTFLTQEPSHSARAFYSFLIVCYLCNQRIATKLIITGFIFLILNKSMSAVIFYFFFLTLLVINYGLYRRFILWVIPLVLVFSGFLYQSSFQDMRFVEGMRRVFSYESLVERGDNSASILTYIGSRRLSQSLAGFMTSDWYGKGLGQSADLFFLDTQGGVIDLTTVSRLSSLEVNPTSYSSQLAYEAGILSLIPLFLLLLVVYKIRLNNSLLFFSFGVFQLMLFSTTTSIFPWLFIGLAANASWQENIK